MGKSVLLKCLMGILMLDGGSVTISDNDPEIANAVKSQSSSSGMSFISMLSDEHEGDDSSDMMMATNPEIGFAPQVLVRALRGLKKN